MSDVSTTDVNAIAAHIGRGLIPAHVYSDPDVFALERDRIFGRAWVFVAHESEIPTPGDFVVRRVVDDSLIVVRDDAGDIRVHFNMCIHRGMQVCRAERGSASHFRCPYHGWSYRNDGSLAGLPFQDVPNHVARAVVIGDLLFDGGRRFGAHFTFDWQLVPYILGDLLLLPFARWLPPDVAGRVLVSCCRHTSG